LQQPHGTVKEAQTYEEPEREADGSIGTPEGARVALGARADKDAYDDH